MATKTFTPAFTAHVGDWDYYLCLMSYAQVAREISFLYELQGNTELGQILQRGIGARTEEIKEYLLTNKHHFLGALVVAAWGGAPEYIPLEMQDNEDNVLAGVDRDFGVLTFDGTQQFFALDGQHRLRAIKDAIKKDPQLATEDIAVIVVPHFDDDAGRQKTRRLFTNINRNAVRTSTQENIALDEDDGFAIITRRLLDEHDFFKKTGVVQVFSKVGDEGLLRLATTQVTGGNNPAWTTIGVLYSLLWELRFDLHGSMELRQQRATDEVLDASYDVLGKRLVQLIKACGDLYGQYEAAAKPATLRAPKGHEGDGHPFMRPVVQRAVVRVILRLIEQRLLTWNEALERLKELDWKLRSAPFTAVWQATPHEKAEGKMITGKDNAQLLADLLTVYLAPTSKAQISRALSSYRSIKGVKYPVTADELSTHLTSPPVEPSEPADQNSE
jgi:DNA sulfur modification protein DndB